VWAEVSKNGDSPDPKIEIAKVVEMPPGAPVAFDYVDARPLPQAWTGLAIDAGADFYVGEAPTLRRVVAVKKSGDATRVVVELLLVAPSALYRWKTRTLYTRFPLAETPPESHE
jgi:hypothetical protein